MFFWQITSVTMGSDPKPSIADLRLHYYENEYLTDTIESNLRKPRLFSNMN